MYGAGGMGYTVLIVGIGVDIVSVSRFTRSFGPRFFSRVFTENEREYIKNKPPQTLAGMFAAKEAAVKAMGTGFSGFWPSAVEIKHDKRGKPYIKLHGAAVYAMPAGCGIQVSISHDETYAVAFAVIERRECDAKTCEAGAAGLRAGRQRSCPRPMRGTHQRVRGHRRANAKRRG
jgi:phosphopantetheine--protein transferase-like protein